MLAKKFNIPSCSTVKKWGRVYQAFGESGSEDGKALITPVFFEQAASTKQLQQGMDELAKVIKSSIDKELFDRELNAADLKAPFSGPVGIQTDAVSLFSNADFTLLIATVLIVFILLILLYR